MYVKWKRVERGGAKSKAEKQLAQLGYGYLNPPVRTMRYAALRESVRMKGKVCTFDVAYLGSIAEEELDDLEAQRRFWRSVHRAFRSQARLRDVSEEERQRIYARLAAIVPYVEDAPDDTRSKAERSLFDLMRWPEEKK
jgi:hypothetical protein